MRTPAAIALTVAMTCASIQSSAAPEPATADAGTFTIEVIVREDVPEGSALSFEVVEANLAELAELLADPTPGTTIEPNGSGWITGTPPTPK